jgi:hypothetical protein
MHFIQPRLHDIYNVPDSNGLAGKRIKSIYKYIQSICRTKRKEGTSVPRNGDLTADDSKL